MKVPKYNAGKTAPPSSPKIPLQQDGQGMRDTRPFRAKRRSKDRRGLLKLSGRYFSGKGNKETELVKSKNGKEYLRVVKEEKTEKRQKDMPTRLNARRKMMRMMNKVKDEKGNNIDLPAKLFNEIAPKYAGKNVGGYTRIIKAGPRRGDGAEVAILQLV